MKTARPSLLAIPLLIIVDNTFRCSPDMAAPNNLSGCSGHEQKISRANFANGVCAYSCGLEPGTAN